MSSDLVGKLPIWFVKFAVNKVVRKKQIEYNKVKVPEISDKWNSLGNITEYKKTRDSVYFTLEQGEMKLNSVDDGIIQLQISKKLDEIPETNAIIHKQKQTPSFYIKKKDESVFIQQKSANNLFFDIEFNLESFYVTVKDGFGVPLFYENSSILNLDKWFFSEKRAGIGCEHYYGFGEKAGNLEKTGETISFWNTDSFAYSTKNQKLYQSQPIQIAVRENGFCYAIVYDNPYRSQIRLKQKDQLCFSQYFVQGGGINYYVILGPSVKGVFMKLTKLLGKAPLPSLATLGHHQSRFSYSTETEVRELASEFRKRKIPCDFIHLDIDYMDEYRIFTFDKTKFPDPKKLSTELAEQGFKLVAITDPGVKVDPEYFMYKEGIKGKHFCLNSDGSPFVGPVWPGDCHFPDFNQQKTREWFGKHFSVLTEAGIKGFWIDMNEPSIFSEIGTAPDDVIHPSNNQKKLHEEVHNLYGHLMSQATYEGLSKLLPNQRIFVLSRSAYLGTHRYAGTWTGDNNSEWSHLRICLPMLMNMAASGQLMIGPDIGGFAGKPSANLLIRWYQAACFFPFFRNHTIKSSKQEPWTYGKGKTAIIKKAIQQRYSFLIYIYNSIRNTYLTGIPSLKAMWIDYPKDPIVYHEKWSETQYLFGDNLLIAPVLDNMRRSREVYLPKGTWYSLEGEKFEGGSIYEISAPLDYLPVFVKAGSIIPYIEEEIQFTEEIYTNKISLRVYPDGSNAKGFIYLDDGNSLNFEKGDYEIVHIDGEVKASDTWYFNIHREGKKKKYIELGEFRIMGEEKSNYLVFER
ncbi:MAG: glycoside hydrolase family 31 protein [Candidatus Heimdallarchaeaceae archaeon]|jgi:alpha-glucosidase